MLRSRRYGHDPRPSGSWPCCLSSSSSSGPRPRAAAHPYLVQDVPGPGTVLSEPPAQIQMGFTEDVVLEGSSLRLADAGGRAVPLGPLRAPQNGAGLAADIDADLGRPSTP